MSSRRVEEAGAGERTRALAAWSGAGATALAGGPVVAGVLVQYLGWRSIFLAALPACAAAYIASVRGLPGTVPARGAGLDPIAQCSGWWRWPRSPSG